ncbi:MAG: hypothetical protein J0651_00310, partial [Actinobacteria bacterium]|nr:hypothetical protein [Actinomycetota bacterium]
MNYKNVRKHIVVVEAYEGFIEYLSDEPEERLSLHGIGLPLEEIAANLDCQITILCWDDWFSHEMGETLVSKSVIRSALQADFRNFKVYNSDRVNRVRISARDPEYGYPISVRGLSPRSHGLINDSGLLFFVSYCLNRELQTLYTENPFEAVVAPMWGGIGYVSQMAKATETHDIVDVPFVVTVTDISAHRQAANQEGFWTRHAIIRRQMEDVSLALADIVLVFGPRGYEIAVSGRLPEAQPPVLAPRCVEGSVINKIANTSAQSEPTDRPVQFFLYEPQEAASGVLSALDSVKLLADKGIILLKPIISGGPPVIFAPMKPKGFEEYWSSRGAVAQIIREQQWEWRREYPVLDK